MKTILFISHDATLTGAPILLLNLMKLLKREGFRIHAIVKEGRGCLLNDFRAASDKCTVYNSSKKRYASKTTRRLNRLINNYRISKCFNVDVIISNTITNGDLLPIVHKYFKGPVFSYIHELEFASKVFSSENAVQNVVSLSDHFIAPSTSVKDFLISSYKVPATKVSPLNYYVPQFFKAATLEVDDYKKSGNISASFIVGCLGTVDWRKGADLFVKVALTVFKKRPQANVQFVWQGAVKKSLEYKRVEYEVSKLGLTDKIVFLEPSNEVAAFFETIDVFLLTSREDPYPLVVLEAASNGKPTICFDKAGGAVEFVEQGCGAVVNFLDTNAMAEKVLEYIDDREALSKDGERAANLVKRLHQNEELIVKQFNTIITSN